MPRHEATWKFPRGYEGLVGNANIEIEVRQSPRRRRIRDIRTLKEKSELLGHLLISRGGIEWRPRAGKKHRTLGWEEFARLMEEFARHVEA